MRQRLKELELCGLKTAMLAC